MAPLFKAETEEQRLGVRLIANALVNLEFIARVLGKGAKNRNG